MRSSRPPTQSSRSSRGAVSTDLRIIAEHLDDSPLLLAGSHGAEFWIPGRGRCRARRGPGRRRAARSTARAGRGGDRGTSTACGSSRRRSGSACIRAAPSPPVAEAANRARRRDRAGGGAALAAPDRPQHRRVRVPARGQGLRDRRAARAHRRVGRAVRRRRRDRRGRAARLGPDDLGVHVGDRPTAATICVPDIPALAALLSRWRPSGRAARE